MSTIISPRLKRGIFIRESSIEKFRRLRTVILDCDGVLIDVSRSYRKAILETVQYYFLNLLRLTPTISLLNLEDVQQIKDTGGFNNDWDCTCAALFYMLSLLVIKCAELKIANELSLLTEKMGSNLTKNTKIIRQFGLVCRSKRVNLNDILELKDTPGLSFSDFTSKLSEEGLSSAEKATMEILESRLPGRASMLLTGLKRLIGYNNDVRRSMLKRLFEEIYLGSTLFERFYKMPPRFVFGRGLIEAEKPIPSPNLFDELSNFEVKTFSIVSGRPRNQALYLLEKFKILNEKFLEKSFMFMEDVLQAEERLYKETGVRINLGKPNPYALMESVKRLNIGNGVVAYVGDTTSDILMAKKASTHDGPPILGVGTLSNTSNPALLVKRYQELGADAIICTINDLPALMKYLLEETSDA